MKTFTLKASEVKKDWYHLDAEGQVLGRMATRIASLLRGKHKPTFTPHMDGGDCVVVTNAEKIIATGKKETGKNYWHHTGFIGGQKSIPLGVMRRTHPERIIIHAVKGMLPHNSLGRHMIKHLKVYAGPDHPHVAQSPKTLEL